MTDATTPTPQPSEAAFERRRSFTEEHSRRDDDRKQRWALTATLAALALMLAAAAFLTHV